MGIQIPGPRGAERVLIVDDEPVVADSLAAVFRMHGYEVRTAYSAEEAMAAFAEWRPDAALVDVVLPGMNGVDLALVLQNSYEHCRVLLFSGCEIAGELLGRAAKMGRTFPILAKPMHPTEVLEAVKMLLAGSPPRNEGWQQVN